MLKHDFALQHQAPTVERLDATYVIISQRKRRAIVVDGVHDSSPPIRVAQTQDMSEFVGGNLQQVRR